MNDAFYILFMLNFLSLLSLVSNSVMDEEEQNPRSEHPNWPGYIPPPSTGGFELPT